jgi:amino acid adenylation domain-containing protein
VTTAFLVSDLPIEDAAVVRIDADAAVIAAHPATPLPDEADAQNVACVIYTSGSTGWPKRIGVTHRGIARLVRSAGELQAVPGDRVTHASNVSFDVTTWEVWAPLLNGGTVVVVDRETVLSAPALARLLREERVTSVFLTTALFGHLARQDPDAFAGVRDVIFGGEAADADAIRRVLESASPPRRLVNAYGPAENTTYTSWHLATDVPAEAATLPIGHPVANTRAYVLDGGMEPVPVGVPGELFAAGDGLARGYLSRPAMTAERFVPDPFGAAGERMYRTGDRARWTAGGVLEYLGRTDRQVKVRGFRVEPGEIEAVLRAHPAVADAAVIVREDRPGDPRLAAYVVPVEGVEHDAAGLRGHLRQRLPEFMVPAAIVALERIPIDPVGKVDRRALPAPETAPAVALSEPRTGLERRVAALWARVLGVDRVGWTIRSSTWAATPCC